MPQDLPPVGGYEPVQYKVRSSSGCVVVAWVGDGVEGRGRRDGGRRMEG